MKLLLVHSSGMKPYCCSLTATSLKLASTTLRHSITFSFAIGLKTSTGNDFKLKILSLPKSLLKKKLD